MLALIIGGAASGKSEYAERLTLTFPGPHIYLATMYPGDAECRARIARHRRSRAGRGFLTVECPADLDRLRLPEGSGAVLVEDLGNWLNNLWGRHTPAQAAARMQAGVENLLAQCPNVVVVSSEIGLDGGGYGAQTTAYQHTLAGVHCALAARAELAVEVWAGKPVFHKKEETGGEKPWI